MNHLQEQHHLMFTSKAGSVFMKIECFCFINQKLMPNEELKCL